MLLILLMSVALGAEVDRAPSGAIVTIRPATNEQACILSSTDVPLKLPNDAPSAMWLIAPKAYRGAIARVTELSVLPPVLENTKRLLAESQTENEQLRKRDAKITAKLVKATTELKAQKKQTTKWAVAALGTGIVIGAMGVGIIVF